MRILLDLRCLSQAKTGIQIVAANFLEELLDGSPKEQLRILASESCRIDARVEDRHIIRSGVAPYDFRRQGKIAALINACDADMVISPTYFMPFGVRKPYIITVHDLIPRKVWLGAPSLYVWAFLGSRMRRARAVWTVSEYSRQQILRYYPELRGHTDVVPSGYITPKHSEPGEKDEHSLLLFASRFRHKNVPFALRTFEILQALSGDTWKLHVVGNASHLKENTLPKGVCLRGRVSDGDLSEIFRHCWGILIPSMEEGFSLPLLEGMSHGCLVFYHRQTAMRETAGEAGIGLDLDRPEEWARAIFALAENTGHGKEQRTRALKRAAEFTRERFGAALHQALARSFEGWPGGTAGADSNRCP